MSEQGLIHHGELVDERDLEIDALREENRKLRSELVAAKREASGAKDESARAVAALRKQLSPLYRALQALFGEIDAMGIDDAVGAGAAQPSRVSAVWEAWKSKLGGQRAQAIDALLLHKDLNTQQLAIAIGCHRNNVPKIIFDLNKAGLIDKNGGRFSLKQL